MPEFTNEELGQQAYSLYGMSVGNRNFRGEPMPSWKQLPSAIQAAWEVAAVGIRMLVTSSETAPGVKESVAQPEPLESVLKAYEISDGAQFPRFNFYQSQCSLSDITIAALRALANHMEQYLAVFRAKFGEQYSVELDLTNKFTHPKISIEDQYDPSYGVTIRTISCAFGSRIDACPEVQATKYAPETKRHGLSIRYFHN